jgi:hypothetical protein
LKLKTLVKMWRTQVRKFVLDQIPDMIHWFLLLTR